MLSTQSIYKLSLQQEKLDANILAKHNLESTPEIFEKRIIAFFVELGEFANEERSFKYWSQKPAAPKDRQLDEYVDGLHFLLSLGNSLNYDFKNHEFGNENLSDIQLKTVYFEILSNLTSFAKSKKIQQFQNLFNDYLTIAQVCNYSETEILQAYDQKNAINFQRQINNY